LILTRHCTANTVALFCKKNTQKNTQKVTPACYAGECGVKLPRAYIGMNRIFLILLFSFYSFSTFAIIIRHDVDIKEYIVDPGELPWLARLQPIGMHGSTLLQRNTITKTPRVIKHPITAQSTSTCCIRAYEEKLLRFRRTEVRLWPLPSLVYVGGLCVV
jgi:alpha-D-ribose 1-methylphosphonate 5-triphosphate synthase subunit PhnL